MDRYLIVFGKEHLKIIPLYINEPEICKAFKIDNNIFTEIIDC